MVKNLYVASCTENGGVFHYHLSDNGHLQLIETLNCSKPMYCVFGKNRLNVLLRKPFFACDNSGLLSVSLKSDGSFGNADPLIDTGGIVSAHLCVKNNAIFVANYLSGSISKIENGSLKKVVLLCSGNSRPHYIIPTPDEEFLVAVDLENDAIVTFSDSLEIVNISYAPRRSGCRHIVFSKNGELAYCVNEKTSTLSIFKYYQGSFTYIKTVACLPNDYCGKTYASAIRLVDDSLYISHRGYNKISKFLASGITPVKIADISCGGNWPRDFIVTDKFIISANEKSDKISIIINGTVQESISIPSPVAVLAKET